MSYSIGILDQSPICPKETAHEALQHTISLAKKAETLGYKRFWVGEHHNMEHVAGVSPEVLIGHLLAHTHQLQVGSGGVMLQHYSPYKVAENFHLLDNLAPGRVNIGIGKAPGGLHLSTKALQYNHLLESETFNERIHLLKHFLKSDVPTTHELFGVRAMPLPKKELSLFLLGGSKQSAQLATELDAHFVYARFLNDSDKDLQSVADWHAKENKHNQRKFIVALAVIAAETEERAATLAEDIVLYEVTFPDGRKLAVPSQHQVNDLKEQTKEPFTVYEKEVPVITGTAASIKEKLDQFHAIYGIDEFIFHTPLHDRDARNTSYEQLGSLYKKEKVST